MKKLMLLAGVLGVFSLGYADLWEQTDNKYGYATKDLEVIANVVDPIDLQVENVTVGNVPKGKIKDHVDKSGKISVTGTAGENVQLFLYDEKNEFLGDGQTLVKRPIDLKGKEGSIVKYNPAFAIEGGRDTDVAVYQLNDAGKLNLVVKGGVDAGATTSLGEHKGILKVRVKYE